MDGWADGWARKCTGDRAVRGEGEDRRGGNAGDDHVKRRS